MNISLERFSRKCSCGKEHILNTKEIIIERNATAKLADVAESLAFKKGVCFISDENTFAFAELASRHVKQALHCIRPHIVLNPQNLHADEVSVERVLIQLPADAKCLVAAGSGTIHDITRYVSTKRGIPFISYPTAASVDGFVATGCAMTWHGFKKTMHGDAPVAVVADTNIFAYAPYRLTASGAGDVLGKYISLADWQISHLVSGEAFCPEISGVSYEAVNSVRDNLALIHSHDIDGMEKLMYALLLSGLAIQMWENSRPASGTEHHFSHFWEMEIINGTLDAMHGEKVGVGLNIALPLYKRIAADESFGKVLKAYAGLPHDALKAMYKGLYDSIIAENTPDCLLKADASLISSHAEDIRGIIAALPDENKLRRDMEKARILTTLSQIGLDDSCLRDSVEYAPFVRNRITLLRLAKLMEFDTNL